MRKTFNNRGAGEKTIVCNINSISFVNRGILFRIFSGPLRLPGKKFFCSRFVLSGLGLLFPATCLLFAAMTAACAAPGIVLQRDEVGQDVVRYWPPPPQTPKIRYVRSISGAHDIGARKSWLKKMADTVWGSEERDEKMLRPYGVAAGDDRLYVSDPGAHLVHVFDLKEKRFSQIREVNGKGLISPIGVAVEKNCRIYLSDSMLGKVFLLDRDGLYIREIGSEKLFTRPAGIAVDDDRVYVVDTHAHRVLVFGKHDGGLLFSFGGNGADKGEFNFPTNIVVAQDGLIYVMDSMNFRVQIFGRDGVFISAFGKSGDGSGDFSKSKGIAVDSEGHIYVADAHFDNVQIFDREARLLLSFGGSGRGQGELVLPAGVFIDNKDMIYVADSYNNRIQIYQYLKEKK